MSKIEGVQICYTFKAIYPILTRQLKPYKHKTITISIYVIYRFVESDVNVPISASTITFS